jgi:hypothetical protein
MTTMNCAELRDVAEELALDLLDGVERAAALTHLETCASCRHDVGTLTEVAEEVLLLAPAAEPSPSFAARVVTQIQRLRAPATVATATRHAGRRRPWGRRFAGLAAAAAIAVLVLVASIVIRGGSGDDAEVLAAEMRTGTGTTVGIVSLRLDDPATATVSVPGWIELVQGYDEPVDATYWLAVEQDDGSRDLHPLPPDGDSTWVVDLDDPGAVAAVSVLDDEGRVWCSARFTAS